MFANKRLFAFLAGATIGSVLATSAAAQTIPGGLDSWLTPPGSHDELPPIPGGFFGPGSDPFTGISMFPLESFPFPDVFGPPVPFPEDQRELREVFYDVHGNEVGPDSAHSVKSNTMLVEIGPPYNFDTVVRRSNDAVFTGPHTDAPVELEMVWLSLKSVAPITVTFNGGQNPTNYDVYVGLSNSPAAVGLSGRMMMRADTVAPNGPGSVLVNGRMEMGQQGDPSDAALAGGDFAFYDNNPGALGLPVAYQLVFRPQGGGADVTFDDPTGAASGGLYPTLGNFHNVRGGGFMFAEGPKVFVASEDFDGNAFQVLPGSFTPAQNQNGGPGDFFGVGPVGDLNIPGGPVWPQGQPTPGVPFNAVDDSVINVSQGTRGAAGTLPTDNRAIFGRARRTDDDFFLVSDTIPNITPANQVETAIWEFDISGMQELMISIDMGAMDDHENSAQAPGGLDDFIRFKALIDGAPTSEQIVFEIRPAIGQMYTYRAFDDGDVFTLSDPLVVGGAQQVLKTQVDTGMPTTNPFVDKSPAQGFGAGLLDSFMTQIMGTGDVLTLIMEARLDGEAFAFDNIVITGVPMPILLPGDYNNDGTVDEADYIVFRKFEGTSTELPNDEIGGMIGPIHFAQWAQHFGQTLAGSGGGQIPEPTSLLLVMVATVGMLITRRRR